MAKVLFKRKTTAEIEALPIVDGQLIYDTETGATYMDVGNERVLTGSAGGGSETAVLYTKMEPKLTPEQKKQARENIGATAEGGSGLSTEEKSLIITIMRNGIYKTDQSGNITNLETLFNGGAPVETWRITNDLTGCSNSNGLATITKGSKYTATITAEKGYTLDGASVTITMGGGNITSMAYLNGEITIESVTGDVTITIVAQTATVQPTLPEKNMLAYFDFRNVDTAGRVGSAYGIPKATKGTGSLYSWGANWASSSNNKGVILGARSAIFDRSGGTSETEMGKEFTVVFGGSGENRSMAAPGNVFYASNIVEFVYAPKYKTTSGEAYVETADGPTQFTGYKYPVVRVKDKILDIFLQGEKKKTYDGVNYSDFVKWADTAMVSKVGYGEAIATAMAIYDRALNDTEVVEAVEFMKTLEVQ